MSRVDRLESHAESSRVAERREESQSNYELQRAKDRARAAQVVLQAEAQANQILRAEQRTHVEEIGRVMDDARVQILETNRQKAKLEEEMRNDKLRHELQLKLQSLGDFLENVVKEKNVSFLTAITDGQTQSGRPSQKMEEAHRDYRDAVGNLQQDFERVMDWCVETLPSGIGFSKFQICTAAIEELHSKLRVSTAKMITGNGIDVGNAFEVVCLKIDGAREHAAAISFGHSPNLAIEGGELRAVAHKQRISEQIWMALLRANLLIQAIWLSYDVIWPWMCVHWILSPCLCCLIPFLYPLLVEARPKISASFAKIPSWCWQGPVSASTIVVLYRLLPYMFSGAATVLLVLFSTFVVRHIVDEVARNH